MRESASLGVQGCGTTPTLLWKTPGMLFFGIFYITVILANIFYYDFSKKSILFLKFLNFFLTILRDINSLQY